MDLQAFSGLAAKMSKKAMTPLFKMILIVVVILILTGSLGASLIKLGKGAAGIFGLNKTDSQDSETGPVYPNYATVRASAFDGQRLDAQTSFSYDPSVYTKVKCSKSSCSVKIQFDRPLASNGFGYDNYYIKEGKELTGLLKNTMSLLTGTQGDNSIEAKSFNYALDASNPYLVTISGFRPGWAFAIILEKSILEKGTNKVYPIGQPSYFMFQVS